MKEGALSLSQTTFNMRIDKELLKFLKMQAIYMDCSMTDLANKLFIQYRERIEKKRREKYTTEAIKGIDKHIED